MSNWSLGPGLTSQIGPFKTHKDDLPKVRKFPWKGGGVPAGGQGHAGHGNYMQTMNPEIFPMGMKPHHSNNYKSIVTIFDINNVSKKSSPMRMKRQTILGRPDEQETSQKMSMGLVDRQHQVPFEQEDKLEEEAEGIKPVQEESPQQVSNQQLFGTGKLKDNQFFHFAGGDKYVTPPETRRGSMDYDFNTLNPQYENHKEHVVSTNMEYKPIEMKEYAHEYLQKDQYQLLPDLSEHASDHRKVEHEMPRLMASDIYTTGALGTQFVSETLTVNEGGDELTPFKPQQIIMDAPKSNSRKSSLDSKRSSISRMDDSTPRTSVPEIRPVIKKPGVPVKQKAGKKRKNDETGPNKKPRRVSVSKPVAGAKRLASQADEEAQTSARAKKLTKIDRAAYNHELKKKALESINTTTVGKARLAAAQSLAKGKQAAADAKILRGKALTSMAKNKTDKALRGHALTSMAKARTAKVYRELAVESMAKNKRNKALASKKNKKAKSAPSSPRVSTSERPSKKTRAKANKSRRKST